MPRKILIAVVSALVPALAEAQSEFPKRKPGLWEITINMAGDEPRKVLQCTDERTDRQMFETMGGAFKKDCRKNEMRRSGDRYVGESDCTYNGQRVLTKIAIVGDFTKAYTTRVDGDTAGRKSLTTMQARFLGACQADQKPGDMIVNGMKFNILGMAGKN
jgi:hypothetical protein